MSLFNEISPKMAARQSGPEGTFPPLEGRLDTLQFNTAGATCSVYCSKQALTAQAVDVIVYAHGLLDRCAPVPTRPPEDLITREPFRLGQAIDGSGRALILIVPLFQWSDRPPALAQPAILNALIEEVLDHFGGLRGASFTVSNTCLSGHSRGHSFLDPVASSYADSQMRQGALAKLSEVWMFDSTYARKADPAYSRETDSWLKLLGSTPGLKISVFYLKNTHTERGAQALESKVMASGGRLRVTALEKVGHCHIPARVLPGLLKQARSGTAKAGELDLDTPSAPRTLREKIVETAEEEWENWKEGMLRETDKEAAPFLKQYWAAVPDAGKFTPKQFSDKTWQAQNPWSAAFVSYVMQKAGAGDSFEYAGNHTKYIFAAKQAADKHLTRKFQAFRINEVPVEPGDIVCKDRPPTPGSPCTGITFGSVRADGSSHGEIVVATGRNFVITIGGNTEQEYPQTGLRKDTVGKRRLRTDDHGYLIVKQGRCPYFAVLKAPLDEAQTEKEFSFSGRWGGLLDSPDSYPREFRRRRLMFGREPATYGY